MRKEITRKLDREVQALRINESTVPDTKRHIVISPTVTRRPALDAMLGDMQIVAQRNLERMRNNALNGVYLDKDDLKLFSEIANMVIRQTRAEMEVERHIEQRTKTQSDKEFTAHIEEKLRERGVDPHVIFIVLEELGLDR